MSAVLLVVLTGLSVAGITSFTATPCGLGPDDVAPWGNRCWLSGAVLKEVIDGRSQSHIRERGHRLRVIWHPFIGR